MLETHFLINCHSMNKKKVTKTAVRKDNLIKELFGNGFLIRLLNLSKNEKYSLLVVTSCHCFISTFST